MPSASDAEFVRHTRRDFLTSTASGLGMIGLGSMLADDGLLTAQTARAAGNGADPNPLAPKAPHFPAKAKSCIFIFMAGAPSQIDLFDPKPLLNKRNGEKLPESMLEKVRFAFIQKNTATLMGTRRKFKKYGQCGMDFSDLLPNVGTCADDILMVRSMHTEQFNHHPGQLMMQCGRPEFGLPVMGSWLTYGLGSESRNLPGYVVLSAGRGSSGGATLWQSGFLPSVHAGVPFRSTGEPILNLANPKGLPPALQRKGLDTLGTLNRKRFEVAQDPEIASRIAAYELAFRMQSAAPELIDLSNEPKHVLDAYGVDRKDLKGGGRGKSAAGDTWSTFARNCLLARRMVEQGVRCVNIIHASWDHHSNLDSGLKFNAGMCDQPIAALIKDLKTRGLLDSTMVVWGSEFGRTPLGENRRGRAPNTGRDHHPFAFTTLMAGGGIKGGQVYGETDEIGWAPVSNPVHVNDFHATLLHCFGMDHLKLTHRFQGRDFRLTDVAGKVVKPWLA